ncbi:MAG: hypothetical protein F6K56_42620 [Moorea sp. SIO3G5]|nr:hypothetical protein [Moorena sp. SIO3G5]
MLQGGPHFPPLALGYVAARNAPRCQTAKMRCTRVGRWGDEIIDNYDIAFSILMRCIPHSYPYSLLPTPYSLLPVPCSLC